MKGKLVSAGITSLLYAYVAGVVGVSAIAGKVMMDKACSKSCNGMEILGQRYQEVLKYDAHRMGIEIK
jgi:hypothetical protein